MPRSLPFLLLALVLLTGVVRATDATAQPDATTVRVRLFDDKRPLAVSLRAVGGAVAVYAGTEELPLLELGLNQTADVVLSGSQLAFESGQAALFARSLRLVPQPGAATALAVTRGRAKTSPRRYEGTVDLSPTAVDGHQLLLVNTLPLEEYVAAVVSREYGFDDVEGAKAMAVIIRTYTLAARRDASVGYDHVDHTASQVYQGIDAVTPSILRAVRATRGEVLTYQGRLIEAVYFSSSGGHTADNETVWRSQPLPYLRGRPDAYDRSSPHKEWRSEIPRKELLAYLSAAHGFEVTGFYLGERSPDDRVRTVDLRRADGSRHTIPANTFRMQVMQQFGSSSLRSTLFTARRAGNKYVFEGRGNGHGVGLSQWGAHELATTEGRTYHEILDYYYTDVVLTTIDKVRQGAPPPARAEAEPPPSTDRRRIGW